MPVTLNWLTSRNSLFIAITTLGEGWHNNHHYYQASARNGFFWWELDVTWYVLKVLSWVGLVHDLKVPSAQILASNRLADVIEPELEPVEA